MRTVPKKPSKWINAKIDSLDPEVDWVEINRLMTTYESSEFILDLLYAYTFPHFMVPTHGAEPVWREGDRPKVVVRGYQRSEDTNHHNMVWAHYGPDHPETRKSVDVINKIHAHYAKDYQNGFVHHDDYVHVWCFSAALMHRLQIQVGLPGYSEKQKIATYRFWKEMAPLFVVPGDDRPIEGYPGDFNGVIEWLAEYEGREWPANDTGAATSQAVLEQFLYRRVIRPLRPAVRSLVHSLWPKSLLKAYSITPPNRMLSAVLRRGAGVALAVYGTLSSDPLENYVERRDKRTDAERREHRREVKKKDDAFARAYGPHVLPAATESEAAAAPPMGCPHPMGQRAATMK